MPALLQPPSPKVGQLQTLRLLRKDPLAFLQRVAAECGDVARFKMGVYTVFLFNRPDFVEDVLQRRAVDFMKGQALQEAKRVIGNGLLTSEGDFHRRQRRLIQPLFRPDLVAAYGRHMVDCALRLQEGWRDGETQDLHLDMGALALDVVARTLFGAELEAREKSEVQESLAQVMDAFELVFSPLARLFELLPLPRARRFKEAQARLDRILLEVIRRRRAAGGRQDLLSQLLGAREEDGGSGMSDEQVRDEAMTLFLAGHETTANALTWTWYLLSQNPAVEQCFHAELEKVLGGREPAADDLPRLPYSEWLFSEAMRLYPPAWVLGRRALWDLELGGYQVPRGSLVLVSQYLMHRDPRYWDEPQAFRPERWSPEQRAARPKFAYFPFGGGPRLCIGESFAWLESLLVLATLGQRWRLRLAPGHPVDQAARITLRPKHGMRMVLSRR